MTANLIKGDLSEALKKVITDQLYYSEKLREELNTFIIPAKYFGTHYCESSGLKCNKQCKFCKDEK